MMTIKGLRKAEEVAGLAISFLEIIFVLQNTKQKKKANDAIKCCGFEINSIAAKNSGFYVNTFTYCITVQR